MPDTATAISRALADRDLRLQRSLSHAYANAFKSIALEQDKFARYVEAQKLAGAPISPSWAAREARYLSLQSQLYQSIHTFGASATSLLGTGLPRSVEEALRRVRSEALAARPAALRGTGFEYPGFGPETWALINKRAIAAANQFINSVESPLRQLLERDLPESAVSAFRREWTSGLLTGKNPLTIARNIQRQVTTLTLGRAQLIARTEFHRAYREGKREQIRSSEVLSGWIWRAALDRRTCPVCFAMHGTFHTADETLEGHPACRCIMVLKTKGWDELGFGGMPDTSPVFESGESIFRRLPADEQLRRLGPSRFKRYQEGTPLLSFVGRRESALWGGMRVLEPLGGISRPRGGPLGGTPVPAPIPEPWRSRSDGPWTELMKPADLAKVPDVRGKEYDRAFATAHPEIEERAIQALLDDVKINGFVNPIELQYSIADRAVLMKDGQRRIEVARRLGIDVPVIVRTQEKAFGMPSLRVKGRPASEFKTTSGWIDIPHIMKPSDIWGERVVTRTPRKYVPKALRTPTVTTGGMPDYVLKRVSGNANMESSLAKEYKATAVRTGKTLQEVYRETSAALQKTIDSKVLATRRSMASAEKILSEGRFKSQFETGKSAGSYAPDYRAGNELDQFAYPKSLAKQERPIYGYADDLVTTGGADWYGEVRFILKQEMRARTTATWSDSLGSNQKPSAVLNVEAKSYDPRGYGYGSTPGIPAFPVEPNGGYIELQFHGGLTINDVGSIHFTRVAPGQRMIGLLERNGFIQRPGHTSWWDRAPATP